MLTPDQKVTYERIRQTAQADLDALDRDLVAELGKVKRRLQELQEQKRAVMQILEGSSVRLGVAKPTPLAEFDLNDLDRYVGQDESGFPAETTTNQPGPRLANPPTSKSSMLTTAEPPRLDRGPLPVSPAAGRRG